MRTWARAHPDRAAAQSHSRPWRAGGARTIAASARRTTAHFEELYADMHGLEIRPAAPSLDGPHMPHTPDTPTRSLTHAHRHVQTPIANAHAHVHAHKHTRDGSDVDDPARLRRVAELHRASWRSHHDLTKIPNMTRDWRPRAGPVAITPNMTRDWRLRAGKHAHASSQNRSARGRPRDVSRARTRAHHSNSNHRKDSVTPPAPAVAAPPS